MGEREKDWEKCLSPLLHTHTHTQRERERETERERGREGERERGRERERETCIEAALMQDGYPVDVWVVLHHILRREYSTRGGGWCVCVCVCVKECESVRLCEPKRLRRDCFWGLWMCGCMSVCAPVCVLGVCAWMWVCMCVSLWMCGFVCVCESVDVWVCMCESVDVWVWRKEILRRKNVFTIKGNLVFQSK